MDRPHFAGPRGNRHLGFGSVRPLDGDGAGRIAAENDGGRGLGPIPPSGGDDLRGAGLAGNERSDDSADAVRISRRSDESDAQAGPGARVVQQLRGGAVLPDHQIHASILVVVPGGGAALFPIQGHSALVARNRGKATSTIAPEDQPASGIHAGVLGTDGEQVLRKEQVLRPIPVEIGNGDAERGGPLGFDGQGRDVEMVPAIEQNHGVLGF